MGSFLKTKKMRTIKHIVLHCTATPQNASIDSIKNYWKTQLGWKNPGYHFMIQADGKVVETLPISQIANGVKGHNAHSIHIAYIGGVKGGKAIDNRTKAQRQAMLALLCKLRPRFSNAEILGHRDLSPDLNNNGIIEPWEWTKECPSFDVRKWLKDLKF